MRQVIGKDADTGNRAAVPGGDALVHGSRAPNRGSAHVSYPGRADTGALYSARPDKYGEVDRTIFPAVSDMQLSA